ncbi:hypothetical protein [Microvirga pudoricolor]|uniref:hypothetical protein n=1 Tax=Microvirga pudoricolor TaxID=2778729 RepID=UPI00194EDA30|nr:hypothetical protein [Microvirga pudoricolor]MBM6594396.1 hypothetical protein [Microvirga pudoricolor]
MAVQARSLIGLAAFVAASLVWGAVRAGEGSPLRIVPTGDVETVFDWSRDACVRTNVPDAPARAFKDSQGTVNLIISHNDNRLMAGPALGAVKPRCGVIYEGRESKRLSDFDDLSWIGGVHTRDGRTVYALAHTELRGDRTPGQCPAGRYSPCLLNTVTALVSRDGGRLFEPIKGDRPPVVATLGYGFPTDRSARVGYSNPTNIIERDGWYYAFIFADAYRGQKRGNCLVRTQDLGDPASWRAWDGRAFTVSFTDPFQGERQPPLEHVCEPVAPHLIGRMIGGIATHRGTGAVIAVFGDRRRSPDGSVTEGMFASVSRDLVTWSPPALVMEARLLWSRPCPASTSYFYPSIIDPDARTPSFEDVGDSGYLYMTRYQLRDCKVTWDRDLVRVPVAVR